MKRLNLHGSAVAGSPHTYRRAHRLPRAKILIEASTESEWVARHPESLGHFPEHRQWTRWAGRRRVAPWVLGPLASTGRGARRRRRSIGLCRITSVRCRRCTTSVLRPRTARGAPSCRRSPTNSSRAAFDEGGSQRRVAKRTKQLRFDGGGQRGNVFQHPLCVTVIPL